MQALLQNNVDILIEIDYYTLLVFSRAALVLFQFRKIVLNLLHLNPKTRTA
jgi:hypothetical protein